MQRIHELGRGRKQKGIAVDLRFLRVAEEAGEGTWTVTGIARFELAGFSSD